MNTDDYILKIDQEISEIKFDIKKIEYDLSQLKAEQKVDNTIKSFIAQNWFQIMTFITLICDLYYTYKVWKPH